MKKFKILIILVMMPFLLMAQNSRKSLETKRKILNKEIQNTSYLLGKTAKDRKQSVQQLSTLKKQVESRTELIKLIKEELDSIEQVLNDKQADIERYSEDLLKLKAAYRKVLILLYRYKTGNDISVFLVAADKYKRNFEKQLLLSKLEKKRSKQATLIRKIQRNLKLEINDLEVHKFQKVELLNEELDQSGVLSKELAEKDRLVKNLKSKEQKLRNDLKKKESAKKQLNNKIENIIKEQIAASKQKSRSYSKSKSSSKPKSEGKFLKTPDYKSANSSFASRKGKIPSPVNRGVITSKFGKQRHPVFEEVFTYNNGIDIKTAGSSTVKAVHQGSVVSVFAVPGNGTAVMLKHGDYYTTYSNLSKVTVKRGDAVKAGQSLGVVGKDINSGEYILHFELWNGKNKENPEIWLQK